MKKNVLLIFIFVVLIVSIIAGKLYDEVIQDKDGNANYEREESSNFVVNAPGIEKQELPSDHDTYKHDYNDNISVKPITIDSEIGESLLESVKTKVSLKQYFVSRMQSAKTLKAKRNVILLATFEEQDNFEDEWSDLAYSKLLEFKKNYDLENSTFKLLKIHCSDLVCFLGVKLGDDQVKFDTEKLREPLTKMQIFASWTYFSNLADRSGMYLFRFRHN